MKIDTRLTIALFNAMHTAIEGNKDYLCELDGAIGDADHGVTMSIGFTAIVKALDKMDVSANTPTDVFNTSAKIFLNAVGASAGPLYATAFMRAGAAVKGINELQYGDLANAIVAMAEGIQARGKAEAGDKTMLDAWLPAAEAARRCKENANINQLLTAVSIAAEEGARATIGMVAKKGRSARLGERSVGHMDAGAASTVTLLSAMASAIPSNHIDIE